MSLRPGSKPLIYVVDDKPALVDLARIGLEALGYSVRGFSNPIEVITAIQQGAAVPDILITDYEMPQMNGLELVRECRRLQPTLKTIMVSGTVESHEIMSDPVRVNRFLSKPYSPANLRDTIGDLLQE